MTSSQTLPACLAARGFVSCLGCMTPQGALPIATNVPRPLRPMLCQMWLDPAQLKSAKLRIPALLSEWASAKGGGRAINWAAAACGACGCRTHAVCQVWDYVLQGGVLPRAGCLCACGCMRLANIGPTFGRQVPARLQALGQSPDAGAKRDLPAHLALELGPTLGINSDPNIGAPKSRSLAAPAFGRTPDRPLLPGLCQRGAHS